jgi:GYF domain 2
MANYKVIGGDLKQYGPVSEEELRKWIADGRLNGQSLVQVYGDIEWKQLFTFPEFAGALAEKPAAPVPPLPSVPPEGGEREAALQKVKVPAIGLIVTAIINLLLSLWSLLEWMFFRPNQQEMNAQSQQLDSALQQLNNPQLQQFVHKVFHMMYGQLGTSLGLVNVFFGLIMSVLILAGALKMRLLRSYEFALTAAILSVVPCLTPCCGYIIGLTFGIWALVVLRRPGVKSQFL